MINWPTHKVKRALAKRKKTQRKNKERGLRKGKDNANRWTRSTD